MTASPVRIDVSHLPQTVFGHRSHMWWGTLGFMMIEGTTLFICIASYFYLRRNFTEWPPAPIPLPSLGWPTAHVLVLLGSVIPAVLADRAARRVDLSGVRRWFVVSSLIGLALLYLRWRDLTSLNVRWDANAYGSIVWATAGLHGTILVLQVVETVLFTIFLFSNDVEERHCSDASDSAFYWYFFVGSWMPLYVMLYLSPRFL